MAHLQHFSVSRDDHATVTAEARELFHEAALKHGLGDAKGAAEVEE